jgi:hypothetical protein
MIITHIGLKNWRNFQSVDVDLRERVFLVSENELSTPTWRYSIGIKQRKEGKNEPVTLAVEDDLSEAVLNQVGDTLLYPE